MAEERDNPACHLGRHRSAAMKDLAQGLEQPRGRRLLQEVAGGPGADRIEHVTIVVVDGQGHQDQGRMPLLQEPDALHAGHPGQAEVYQHRVGQRRAQVTKRLLHGPEGLQAAIPGGAADEGLQALPETGLILDDGDAEGSRLRPPIRRARSHTC
jgi:hypothetical protein